MCVIMLQMHYRSCLGLITGACVPGLECLPKILRSLQCLPAMPSSCSGPPNSSFLGGIWDARMLRFCHPIYFFIPYLLTLRHQTKLMEACYIQLRYRYFWEEELKDAVGSFSAAVRFCSPANWHFHRIGKHIWNWNSLLIFPTE